MKPVRRLLVILFVVFLGCQNAENPTNIEKWKSEINEVEKAFCEMAQEKGISKAFEYYAAEDAIIKRGEKIIKGKEAIATWHKKNGNPNQTLVWEPTFIHVSNTGDLAYTYGDYVVTYVDSLGVRKESKGIFHTVWKRQSDGEWKFVWD